MCPLVLLTAKAFDAVKYVGLGPVPRRVNAVRSVLSEEKKLFIVALSQTFPERLMLQVTP